MYPGPYASQPGSRTAAALLAYCLGCAGQRVLSGVVPTVQAVADQRFAAPHLRDVLGQLRCDQGADLPAMRAAGCQQFH